MPSATLAAAARAPMRPAVVVMLLTLLLGIQPVTTDLYLPALIAWRILQGTAMAAAVTGARSSTAGTPGGRCAGGDLKKLRIFRLPTPC